MNTLPNFLLNSSKVITNAFIQKGITDYHAAAQYIKSLPYGRNKDKKNLLTIFDDKYGTCSTKHALLYQLALEHNRTDISLMMGIFKMDADYAPAIRPVLEKYSLLYIPEAHNYLLFDNQRVDCTTYNSKANDFEHKLLEEQIIEVKQITDFKINYHKAFLKKWLDNSIVTNLTANELWDIRELCIFTLSK